MTERLRRGGSAAALHQHLEVTHNIEIAETEELDVGVVRVRRADGVQWVARVLPAERSVEAAHGDVEVLRALAAYPAERPACEDAVSVFEEQAVVVTEFVMPVPRRLRRTAIVHAGGLRELGGLLGRLHTSDAPIDRPGGAWHHLADGLPADEIDALRAMLDDTELLAEVEGLPDGTGLPLALVHPDFVLPNVVASLDGGIVVVDWTGAGRGPRAWSLAFALWGVGWQGDLTRAERFADGYARHVRLEPEELDALPALVRARPVVFAAWAAATGRRSIGDALTDIRGLAGPAEAIAARARVALLRA